MFADADLVIAVGASLTYYTVDGGALFPKATVIQIDERPLGLRDGMLAAELFVKADAKSGVEAITAELRRRGAKNGGFRSPKIAERIATAPIDSAEFSDRARHVRSTPRHRGARPRHPQGLGHGLRLRPPILFPDPPARPQT